MRPITVFGLNLVAIGLLAWAYCAVIYATAPDPAIRFGPVAMILSGIAVVGGIILLAAGGWRRTTGGPRQPGPGGGSYPL
jgi:hypothetical protein